MLRRWRNKSIARERGPAADFDRRTCHRNALLPDMCIQACIIGISEPALLKVLCALGGPVNSYLQPFYEEDLYVVQVG